jgi:hypothetical protein
MNIVLSEGGKVLIDFEIAKDSHIYFNNGNVDFYREWEDLPVANQEKFLKIANLIYQALNTELTKIVKSEPS